LLGAALGCGDVALLRDHADIKQIHVSFNVSQESRARARQPAVVPKIAAAACYPIVMIELIFILAPYLSGLLFPSKASGRIARAIPCQFPASPTGREDKFPARHAENPDKINMINGLSGRMQILPCQFPDSRENPQPLPSAPRAWRRGLPLPARYSVASERELR
jgi:hypothetical protein